MMTFVLNPNTSHEEISDQELIEEFENPEKYHRWHIYDILAKRAGGNDSILDKLISSVNSRQFQSEVVMGFIKHSWLPIISALNQGDDRVLNELCSQFIKWPQDEKELFVGYIKLDSMLLDRLKKACDIREYL